MGVCSVDLKIELNSEIWGEWGVTYGRNGCLGGEMKTPAQYISERKAAGETAGEREEGSGEEEMDARVAHGRNSSSEGLGRARCAQ